MKKLLLGLIIFSCATMFAYLPEDEQLIVQKKAELHACEQKIEELLKQNARIAEEIATVESAASVREVVSKKKTIPTNG